MVKAPPFVAGQSLKSRAISPPVPKQKLIAIKAPVLSMSKLTGVDTYLGRRCNRPRGHGCGLYL
jgi:hypothetical protein